MRLSLHGYQRDGVLWLVQHPEAALFWDPGLGKTSVALKAYQALQAAGAVRRALVVAPLRPAYQVWSWAGELGHWDDFHALRVRLLHGPRKAEELQYEADLYVINYDGLLWLVESGGLKALLDRGVDCLILDELSKMKHPNTRRFKVLKPWLGRFRRRFGLTGTPAANGLEDLFGEAYCLDLGRALGRFITHYRQQYFVPTGHGAYTTWAPQHNAEQRIFAALAPVAQSLKATDCLDLPELVERDVWVGLPAAASEMYRDLERELITLINNVKVTAANRAVALGKCRQLCGGAVYHDEVPSHGTRGFEVAHAAKLEALADLVDELQGQPLLVAYEFQHELLRLRKMFGAQTPAICGGASMADTQRAVDAWNRGDLPVLLVHPAAAAHGLNLQRGGAHVCWYTLTYDLELYEQLNRRLWRQGSTASRVIVHRLLVRGSVDAAVRDTITRKRSGQDELFAALRVLVDERQADCAA